MNKTYMVLVEELKYSPHHKNIVSTGSYYITEDFKVYNDLCDAVIWYTQPEKKAVYKFLANKYNMNMKYTKKLFNVIILES